MPEAIHLNTIVPINKPLIGKEEKAEVMKVLNEVALTSAASEGGKRVREFETSLKEFLGVKHVLAVNSGTSAIQAALMAAGIRSHDEVILPSFTFVATANAVMSVGARPIFVDINKEDYTMDVKDFYKKVNRRTKAVIPVHLYGHPVNMDKLKEMIAMADARGKTHTEHIQIIEDACQSMGSTIGGKQTGTFGLMGCFSLYASKVITSGEGGAVVTDDDEMAERVRMIRNHGMVHGYDTKVLGLNLRMPELCAALAKVQMTKLRKMLAVRKHNAMTLTQLLDTTKVTIPIEGEGRAFNWYLYTVRFKDNYTRERAKAKLAKDGIGSAVYYDPPVHKTPYYVPITKQWTGDTLKNTEWCAERVLSVPVHPLVKDDHLQKIAHVLISGR